MILSGKCKYATPPIGEIQRGHGVHHVPEPLRPQGGHHFDVVQHFTQRPDSDEKIISTVCDNDVISGSYVLAFSNKDDVVTPTPDDCLFDVLFTDIFWCERSMCLNMLVLCNPYKKLFKTNTIMADSVRAGAPPEAMSAASATSAA